MADTPFNDICLCGRLAVKIHCPICGSYTVYGTPSKMERVLDRETNQMRNVMTFRCRRCASVFNDDEWRVNCRAPHLRRTRAQHDPVDDVPQPTGIKTVADVPDHLREALRKVAASRGVDIDNPEKS